MTTLVRRKNSDIDPATGDYVEQKRYLKAKQWLGVNFGDTFVDPDIELKPDESYVLGTLTADIPPIASVGYAVRFLNIERTVVDITLVSGLDLFCQLSKTSHALPSESSWCQWIAPTVQPGSQTPPARRFAQYRGVR